MVTHDPRAASFADRIVFLKDGQIVFTLANGDHAEPISVQRITEVMTRLEL